MGSGWVGEPIGSHISPSLLSQFKAPPESPKQAGLVVSGAGWRGQGKLLCDPTVLCLWLRARVDEVAQLKCSALPSEDAHPDPVTVLPYDYRRTK